MPSLSFYPQEDGSRLVLGSKVGLYPHIRSDELIICCPLHKQQKVAPIIGSLINIKQRKGKSFHDYINHFNTAILEARDLNQLVVMIALKDELQKNSLLYFLEKKYLKDFAEMLHQAEKVCSS